MQNKGFYGDDVCWSINSIDPAVVKAKGFPDLQLQFKNDQVLQLTPLNYLWLLAGPSDPGNWCFG